MATGSWAGRGRGGVLSRLGGRDREAVARGCVPLLRRAGSEFAEGMPVLRQADAGRRQSSIFRTGPVDIPDEPCYHYG